MKRFKVSLLSLGLVALIFTATGCGLIMDGAFKKAYSFDADDDYIAEKKSAEKMKAEKKKLEDQKLSLK